MATLKLVGSSAKFRALLDNVDLVAPVDSAVLIQGETGTGKEVIARAIHEVSPRRRNRFVALNCAAIPSALLESELFGYEKGAFTGAANQTIGRFQVADRGTLFLDEIGDLPLELQPKLLRVLKEKQFERLGSNQAVQIDVRVIAATNPDLGQMVRERRFRADLYYRLNVFPMTLPPLRERRDDIALLTETEQSAKLSGRKSMGPVCLKCEAFQRGTRRVLPPGPESLCDVFGSSKVIRMATPFSYYLKAQLSELCVPRQPTVKSVLFEIGRSRAPEPFAVPRRPSRETE
jgi:transcriptional regulator with GAF, ATPase, and Fis domain